MLDKSAIYELFNLAGQSSTWFCDGCDCTTAERLYTDVEICSAIPLSPETVKLDGENFPTYRPRKHFMKRTPEHFETLGRAAEEYQAQLRAKNLKPQEIAKEMQTYARLHTCGITGKPLLQMDISRVRVDKLHCYLNCGNVLYEILEDLVISLNQADYTISMLYECLKAIPANKLYNLTPGGKRQDFQGPDVDVFLVFAEDFLRKMQNATSMPSVAALHTMIQLLSSVFERVLFRSSPVTQNDIVWYEKEIKEFYRLWAHYFSTHWTCYFHDLLVHIPEELKVDLLRQIPAGNYRMEGTEHLNLKLKRARRRTNHHMGFASRADSDHALLQRLRAMLYQQIYCRELTATGISSLICENRRRKERRQAEKDIEAGVMSQTRRSKITSLLKVGVSSS